MGSAKAFSPGEFEARQKDALAKRILQHHGSSEWRVLTTEQRQNIGHLKSSLNRFKKAQGLTTDYSVRDESFSKLIYGRHESALVQSFTRARELLLRRAENHVKLHLDALERVSFQDLSAQGEKLIDRTSWTMRRIAIRRYLPSLGKTLLKRHAKWSALIAIAGMFCFCIILLVAQAARTGLTWSALWEIFDGLVVIIFFSLIPVLAFRDSLRVPSTSPRNRRLVDLSLLVCGTVFLVIAHDMVSGGQGLISWWMEMSWDLQERVFSSPPTSGLPAAALLLWLSYKVLRNVLPHRLVYPSAVTERMVQLAIGTGFGVGALFCAGWGASLFGFDAASYVRHALLLLLIPAGFFILAIVASVLEKRNKKKLYRHFGIIKYGRIPVGAPIAFWIVLMVVGIAGLGIVGSEPILGEIAGLIVLAHMIGGLAAAITLEILAVKNREMDRRRMAHELYVKSFGGAGGGSGTAGC